MQSLQSSLNKSEAASFGSRCWRTASEIGALGFVFYLWMLSQSALAASPSEGERYSSLWLTPIDEQQETSEEKQRDFSALQLETNVRILVTGPISRVVVKQTFSNHSQLWVEGEYHYPLPETAAVDHLRMYIGERVVEGQIQEKQQAAKTFAKARKEGKRASLLSHRRANQFRTQVTNIGPQEQVTIEFEYQQFLDFKEGRYDLRFPMVASPAYTPSLQEGSRARIEKDFIFPDNHFRSPNEMPGNPVTITVDLDAGIPLSTPVSVSHPVSVEPINATRYRVELAGQAELSNRDFLLSWQPTSTSQPRVTVLQEAYQGDHYGMLMIMPHQEEFTVDDGVNRELVLVLDVSGSMQGASIRQAKAALIQALGKLKGGDFFNLIWFNNSASSLFPVSQQASARNLALARHKVHQLSANGGTNMLSALNSAFEEKNNLPTSSDDKAPVLRQVVFITDGAVSNEEELFTMIRQQLGDSRLFTVGIGSAPNSYFMRKAAAAGRGSFTYVNRAEELESNISALFKQLESPALTDVNIDFQGYELALFPNPLPDVYLGEPLYAVFKAQQFPEYVTVSGRLNGGEVYMPLSLQSHSEDDNDGGVSSVEQRGIAGEWARRKIEYLLERHHEADVEGKKSAREGIVSLAMDHHLVSKFTSLVVVDVAPVRAGATLNSQKLPANLPKGWALGVQNTQTLQLAQTSTGLWFQLYSGMVALCLAGILFCVKRIRGKESAC